MVGPDSFKLEVMSIEEAILEKVRRLPPDKQSELLALADSLGAEARAKAPLRSPRGLWAGLDIDISEADVQELRHEMWKKFPRDL